MDRPKIGLALGSGGARGFAHLGVIKVLVENKIPIDYIAGSSMGSLVACFYGSGLDLKRLYKISTAFKRKYYLDFTVPKMGFIAGKKIKEFNSCFYKRKKFRRIEYSSIRCCNRSYEGRKGCIY